MKLADVAIIGQQHVCYPDKAPFNPPASYQETPIQGERDESNFVYDSVRNLLILLEYDKANYGTKDWNPLGWLINPGETIFIKPNMISHKHTHSTDWNYVITHGSVIRAVIDYVFIALRGRGKIIIGDAPQTDSNFEKIIELMGLKDVQRLYKDHRQFEIEVIDLRDEYWVEKDGIYVEKVKLPGDPLGGVVVDLARHSMFTELDGNDKNYYGAFYDTKETNVHHRDGKHEYAISRSPIVADVFINIPKLKTHKKCGLTVNLKSLVGINANKNWLPHYTFGSPETGGDQFDREGAKGRIENSIVVRAKNLLLQGNPMFKHVARKAKTIAYQIFGTNEDVIRSGNWHGNDTVWRMCLDLNRILLYANPDGSMRNDGQAKRYFSVVDGMFAMEGNGPVAGTMKKAGILIGGSDPVAVDTVCAKLMGFDYEKIPLLARSFEEHEYTLTRHEAIKPRSNVTEWDKLLNEWSDDDLLHFQPHFGWAGKIELEPSQSLRRLIG